MFLEHCQKLLEKFRYPWEMMPLMYVILKDAGADIEEASRRIEEGKCEFQHLRYIGIRIYHIFSNKYAFVIVQSNYNNKNILGQHVVNEYSRQHNLNIYDGGELRSTTRQCG